MPFLASRQAIPLDGRTANLERLVGRLEAGEVFCLPASQKRPYPGAALASMVRFDGVFGLLLRPFVRIREYCPAV